MSKAVIGHPAPAFTATAVVDGDFKTISLSDYKGQYVVLFFYPMDLWVYVHIISHVLYILADGCMFYYLQIALSRFCFIICWSYSGELRFLLLKWFIAVVSFQLIHYISSFIQIYYALFLWYIIFLYFQHWSTSLFKSHYKHRLSNSDYSFLFSSFVEKKKINNEFRKLISSLIFS